MSKNVKERDNWTDKNWATVIGCPVERLPEIRKIIDDRYAAEVGRVSGTDKYAFGIYKFHVHPSDFKTLQPFLSSSKTFNTLEEARNVANSIISDLEITQKVADIMHIPKRSIQLLHIQPQQLQKQR